jgi:hypothetical protein
VLICAFLLAIAQWAKEAFLREEAALNVARRKKRMEKRLPS